MSKRTKIAMSAGFTLVEAMVAISILSLAITGPMIIAQKGIESAVYAKDQVTAFYLAEEAVEYIRNVRDTNRIKGASWLNHLSPCTAASGGGQCTIDAHQNIDFTNPAYTAPAVQACTGTCPALQFDPVNDIYGYASGWQTTKFTRTVSIDDTADPTGKEASISVNISWNTGLFSPLRTFTVKEYIFDF